MPSPSANPAAQLSRPLLHNPVVATVLVVDDDPIVLDVVVRYLEQDGFGTLTAADGEAARSILERESPSLVVLDVMLPGIDGLSRSVAGAKPCVFAKRDGRDSAACWATLPPSPRSSVDRAAVPKPRALVRFRPGALGRKTFSRAERPLPKPMSGLLTP